MDIELLNSVPVLSRVGVAGLEIYAIGRITGAEREGLWLCGELELSCKLSFCQDPVRTRPRTVIWTNSGARDLGVVGNVLDSGESLDHARGGKPGDEATGGLFACMIL